MAKCPICRKPIDGIGSWVGFAGKPLIQVHSGPCTDLAMTMTGMAGKAAAWGVKGLIAAKAPGLSKYVELAAKIYQARKRLE